jgi:hypothetical protein
MRQVRALAPSPFVAMPVSKIFEAGPDYFKIPHDGVIEVGFRIEI